MYFCLASLADFSIDIDSGIWLINQSFHWYQVFFDIGLVFAISCFSDSSLSARTALGMCLSFGLVMGGILILDLGLCIDLGLDNGTGVGMDVDTVVNIFSSCCLDIISVVNMKNSTLHTSTGKKI